MSDILNRLREDAGRKTLSELIQEREAAAQEIERLRQGVVTLRSVPPHRSSVLRSEAPPLPAHPPLEGRVLVRIKDVALAVGLSRSSIYRMVSEGSFPAPLHLSTRTIAWKAADIQAWVDSRRST